MKAAWTWTFEGEGCCLLLDTVSENEACCELAEPTFFKAKLTNDAS